MTLKTNYQFYLEASKKFWKEHPNFHLLNPKNKGKKVNPESRLEKILHLKKEGLTLQAIGNKVGMTKQRVSQLIRKTEQPKENRKSWIRRYIYYCNLCQDIFRSKLSRNEAVCLKCGHDKIMSI